MSKFRRALAGIVAGVLLLGAGATFAAPVAYGAPDDGDFIVSKSVSPVQDTYAPGDQFSYIIQLTCNSNLVAICLNTSLADTLPPPLVFDPQVDDPVVVVGAGNSTVEVGADSFTVDFTSSDATGTGMPAGQLATITVYVEIPSDISADYNDAPIVNTATATSDSALTETDDSPIVIAVPEVLDSTVQKSVDDHQAEGSPGVPALVGQPVDYTVGGGNASNRSVDQIIVQDPADGTTSPFDPYLDFTGITSITPPAGADQVQIEWLDADGNWTVAYPTGPIPADPSGIPDVDPLSQVQGLRFTFSNSTGALLPPTPAGEEASIGFGAETNDDVLDIPPGTDVPVPNSASSQIVVHDDPSVPRTAPGDVVVSNQGPTVVTTKGFNPPTVLAGENSTATISATNGFRPVTSMVIQEPSPGSPDLAEQGLDFVGFTGGVVWPPNATGASVEYVYADGTTETLDAGAPNTLPDPTGAGTGGVVGFTVTFTGPIIANANASIPFEVTAQPVDTPEDVTSTNETTTTVTDETGASGTGDAEADLTRQPGRLSTVITKSVARSELWAVPGTSSTVSIFAGIDNDGANASTIGSDHLTISDPPDPQPGDPITPFWNAFDLSQITVGVPANADLQIQYWDGDEWIDLPGGQLDGAGTLNVAIPGALREEIQGIRFVFTPKPGELLPPGFQVTPSLSVVTRDQFRDGSGSVADAAAANAPLTVPNTAESSVDNPNDPDPSDNTAQGSDSTDLLPIDDGDGIDAIAKSWLDDPDPLYAFSDEQRTARLSWSTEGLPFDSVTLTDDPSAAPSFDDSAVAASVFDAWDLVEIGAIDAGLDPAMPYDRIAAVELFLWDETAGTGAWVDVTAAACPSAADCDGAFPGYVLSDDERENARAVRLVYEEGSNRGGGGPVAGSGVAPSYDQERNLDLVFELRNAKRSDGGPVTGTLHSEDYNSGSAGVVVNTGSFSGEGIVPIEQEASAPITILDSTVDVSVTKEFDQDELPVPPLTTPDDEYPLVGATLTARNETPANVLSLELSDPAEGSGTTTYEYLNLASIDSIAGPIDDAFGTVRLTREDGGTDEYPISVALGFSAADLLDVVGVTVVYEDPDDVTIPTFGQIVVHLTYQARQTLRSDPATPVAVGDQAVNVAGATAIRPGGDPQLDTATGTAADSVLFVDATYGVEATKTIDPESRYENEPREGYTVTLSGQPTGNVRTTVLTLTDAEPTFWNAFEFAAFPSTALPSNLHQVRVSALTGVVVETDGTNLTQTCGGSSDLTACWVVGDWQDAAAGDNSVTPALPASVSAADVRGLRIEVRVDAASSNWENPINPIVAIPFTADRLENLHVGPGGEIDSVAVPSTQPGLQTAPGETVQGTTSNSVDVHGDGAWVTGGGTLWEADASAGDDTQLLHLPSGISVEKLPGNGSGGVLSQRFPPASRIPYVMTITNTGQWPIEGLTLTDQVGADADGALLEPVPGADPVFEFELTDAGGTELDTDGFAGSLDPVTGEVEITVPDGFVFQPGDVLVITSWLQFRSGLAPATPVVNSITATSDRIFDTCESTELGLPVDAETDADSCTASTSVAPSAAAPIGLEKTVKGSAAGVPGAAVGSENYDDLGVLNFADANSADACATGNSNQAGYYKSTCLPITRPGGIATWRVDFTNIGNVAAESVGGIDVLPIIGDTGVTVGSSRGSQWSPVFAGNVQFLGEVNSADVTVEQYYLETVPDVACNAADIEYTTRGTAVPPEDPCYADLTSRDWVLFDPNTLPLIERPSMRALKTVVRWDEGSGLQPGTAGGFTFDTRTPYVLPDSYPGGLPVAWNAVAAGAAAVYQGTQVYQGPVEPVRAGIAVPTGRIDLQKEVVVPDGWTAPLPDSYDFGVQCLSGPVGVDLVSDAGDPASPVTVPADGSVVTFGDGTNLPLYANCTVQETPAQGSTVTYDPSGVLPSSGVITAQRDLTERADVHHPAGGETELERVLVTNEYEYGGFSVVKRVTEGGAVDQNGDPIAFDPEFTFTASCTFNGAEMIPAGDSPFTLSRDETATFDSLPVGSECTVAETDAAGATTSNLVVTENGVAGPPTEDSADFVVLADDDEGAHVTAVDVENVYTVGSLEITKQVTGDGAADWAADSFTVHVTCTWDQATTNPVYDDTATLADGETWAIDDLPTGAECTVEETDDGGATEVAVTPNPVVIGDAGVDAAPVAVAVENDYRVGGFEIAKSVVGPGVGFSDGVDFAFHYVCTYEGATVGEGDLSITGDGTAGPLVSDPVEGLPVGTACTIEETDAGGADLLPDPVDVTIPDEADGTAQVVTADLENRYSAGTITVTKALAGDGMNAPQAIAGQYTVHVTCALTDGGTPVYEGDVVVGGDGTPVTVADPDSGDPLLLPIGTHCWGVETDDGGASASSVDYDSFDNAVIVVATESDDPQELGITATNTFDFAEIEVTKLVTGNPDHAAGTTFTILVSCVLDREPPNEPVVIYDQEPVELVDGETVTLGPVPYNATCYAEEPDGMGAWDIQVSAPEDAPITVVPGPTQEIVVTNDFPDAGFSVTKTIDNGGAADQGGSAISYEYVYRFEAECTFEGETVLEEEFELADGATQDFTGLPAGAECTVDEIETQGAASTTMVLTRSGVDVELGETSTSGAFTLDPDDDGQSVTALAVTNHYTVGSLEITKSVVGTGADAWGGTFGDFEVHLVCTLEAADPDVVYDGTGTLTADAPGNVLLVENLPTGAECSLSETDDGGATESTITPDTVLIGDDATDEPAQFEVENDFRTGSLDVLKELTGPGAPVFSEGDYAFRVVCTYEFRIVVNQPLVVHADGGEGPFSSDVITGIPVGATCVVAETAWGNADGPAAPVTVTIPDQDEPGVESVVVAGFMNPFSLGTLELTKAVDGSAADADYVADAVFTVQVTCQIEVAGELVTLYGAPVQITAGETVEIVDADGDPVQLPGGAHCFGEETDDGGATAASVDFDSYDNAAIVEASDEPQELEITATNTFDSGSLDLSKTVSGAVAEANGKVFVVAVTCVFDRGANDPYTALDAAPVVIAAGETQTLDGLPIGAECWAEETDAGGAVEVTVSATAATPVTIGADAAVVITIDNRFDPPLPSTGIEPERAVLIALGLLLLGGGVVAAGYLARRRRFG
ncbi:DUF5979 domain-containing protein [Agromyces seonyuensis]|uniref:DUF5979 domain-containing protein n=1 Tax=Agromyces seonyuensis TaxID=2662446 RepID=A0A6I4P4E4_9MICO|nr:DUF5979 domain-containing protein [Agromyces seonyuensis]MWB99775.1 hypothetical protein [Agromyces seonyuensis]